MNFVILLCITLCMTLILSLIIQKRNPTSLFMTIFFGATLIQFLLLLFMLFARYDEQLAIYLMLPFIIVFLFFSLFWIVILIVGIIINTHTVLKHERKSIANLLPVLTLVAAISIEILLMILNHYFKDHATIRLITTFVSASITYIVTIFIIYTCTAVLYKYMPTTQKMDYILVLGAGLNKNQVTPLLAGRIDAAMRFYIRQLRTKNKAATIIVCGGQGVDETISEAQAMHDYIVTYYGHDIRIYLEDESTTTAENFQFAEKKAIDQDGITGFSACHIALATSSYHLLRAGKIAQQQSIRAFGIGGKTKFYYIPTAFIREFIGYIVMKRRLHGCFLALLFVFLLLNQLL
ncbi:YdcF family protein [Kurthia sibirica]|uniref:DUF218 domain-containing protein n=1 Tax=Kurthia sibirica TaxID=202750 RepID=A0A2U3ALK4_9BACL|nr:YdcF family protein [Kurthia sibirica]PWI25390.1 hypothetical protein DEX24_08615 [Kurthia sibirica]GEK34592.1 membrane protein [Kurthia sibirica]